MKLVYGTSAHLIDFADMFIPQIINRGLKSNCDPAFFFYPKGKEWYASEERLFEPYEEEAKKARPSNVFAKNYHMSFMSLQGMCQEITKITMGEAGNIIRNNRERKSFLAASIINEKPIYVSSKDRRWRDLSGKTIQEVINKDNVKLGGSFIYFVYGMYLAHYRQTLASILCEKTKNDVLGAFWAGASLLNSVPCVLTIGEFYFMTLKQWKMWSSDGITRRVPLRVASRLMENDIVTDVRRKLLKREYCSLCYDEERDRFFYYE